MRKIQKNASVFLTCGPIVRPRAVPSVLQCSEKLVEKQYACDRPDVLETVDTL